MRDVVRYTKQKINKASRLGMVKIQTDSLDYFQHIVTCDRESRMTLYLHTCIPRTVQQPFEGPLHSLHYGIDSQTKTQNRR